MKEILFVIFGFILLAGLVVLRLKFTKNRNADTKILIDALRNISGGNDKK